MFTVLAIALSAIIGFVGAFIFGWPALFVTLPLAILLGFLGGSMDAERY